MLDLDRVRAKLREIVPAGLIGGKGTGAPGSLCIESAICLALGEPHGDNPSCVAPEDRAYAIVINDAPWPSPQARAEALLPLGLAQLGTAGTDRSAWVARVVEGTIRRVLPIALRAAADAVPGHAAALHAAADRCRDEGTRDAAYDAYYAAAAAYCAARVDAAAHASSALAAYYRAANASAARASDAALSALEAASAYPDGVRGYAADAVADAAVHAAVLHESVAVALDAYAAEGRA